MSLVILAELYEACYNEVLPGLQLQIGICYPSKTTTARTDRETRTVPDEGYDHPFRARDLTETVAPEVAGFDETCELSLSPSRTALKAGWRTCDSEVL